MKLSCLVLSLAVFAWGVIAETASAEDAKPQNAAKHVFVANVDEIIDGDSFVVEFLGEPISIRIEGIDAPESLQPYFKESKRALAATLPKGSKVVIEELMRGKYGRVIGHVYRREFSRDPVGLALVKSGAAWHFDRYNKSPVLRQAQIEARAAKRGLWKLADAQAPFAHRVELDAGEVSDPSSVRKPGAKYEQARKTPTTFWLNEKSGQRHLVGCPFSDHEDGRPCGANAGEACGVCLRGK